MASAFPRHEGGSNLDSRLLVPDGSGARTSWNGASTIFPDLREKSAKPRAGLS